MRLKIKQIRKERKLTVEELAGLAGLSKSYLSEIENHKKMPNGNRIEQIAKALGVTAIDLIDDNTVSEEIIKLMHHIQRLSKEDQAAIINHAYALKSRTE